MPNRVLVIEDNPAARYAICKSLVDAGMKVTSAAHAEEALPLWNLASGMLVDVHLPGMSGIEFCRHVRDNVDGTAKRVVLFSSQFQDQADRDVGLAAGADLCVQRPVDAADLARLVKKLLFPDLPARPAGPAKPA